MLLPKNSLTSGWWHRLSAFSAWCSSMSVVHVVQLFARSAQCRSLDGAEGNFACRPAGQGDAGWGW